MKSPDALDEYVRALLPFNRDQFQNFAEAAEPASGRDAIEVGAAVASSFAAVVRSEPELLNNQAQRLNFCISVSRSDFFQGELPVWMVEALIQGALGWDEAIEGIPPEWLSQMSIIGLIVFTERFEDSDYLSRLVGNAVALAGDLLRLLEPERAADKSRLRSE